MFILINKNTNVCCFNGASIEFGVYDEPIEKWRIESDTVFYVVDSNLQRVEVETLPSDYQDLKYCYTEEKGFYLNEEYSEPIDPDSEFKRLAKENEELKKKIASQETIITHLDSQLTDTQIALTEIFEILQV